MNVEVFDILQEGKYLTLIWTSHHLTPYFIMPNTVKVNSKVWVHEFSELAIFSLLPPHLREKKISITFRNAQKSKSVPHLMVSCHLISMANFEFISPDEFAKEILLKE